MGVYINIEMPTNCAHCIMWSICPALPNGEWPDYESILTNDVIGDGGAAPGIRHPDCPLVPVPPHGRLGDLDRLEQMFADIDNAPYSSFDGSEPFYSAEDAAQIIRLSPTIIQADIEEEEMK